MASEGLPEEGLSDGARDWHRAVVSLMEECDAGDWCNQRVEKTVDPHFEEILAHDRDEELERAAMLVEWIRRRSPRPDIEMKTYLYSDGSIVRAQKEATGQ